MNLTLLAVTFERVCVEVLLFLCDRAAAWDADACFFSILRHDFWSCEF
jgi:hypothetical protein